MGLGMAPELETESHISQKVTLGLGRMARGPVDVAVGPPKVSKPVPWPADGGELPTVERSVIYNAGEQRMLGMSGKPVAIVIPKKSHRK